MKKLLSIILAVTMALSLMCSSINAAEIDQTEPQTVLPEISDNSESTESDSEDKTDAVTEPVIGTGEETDAGTEQEVIADEQGSDADAEQNPVTEAEQDSADEPTASEEIDPPMLLATADATNGQCGDNAYWDYDPDTQTLTISGAGDMWGFNGSTLSYDRIDPPWDNEEFVISNLVISDEITSIGENAFYRGNRTKADYEFTSVNLPSALTKIGNHAFYHSKLTSIAFPSTLTQIGDSAFYGSNLVSVHIPGTVKTIDYNAFGRCSMLSSVILDEGITDIKAGAFYGTAIESIVFPESVLSIGTYADCKNLSQIHLPSKLTDIQYAAFRNCTSLGTVTIPAAVESIDDYAFRDSPNQIVTFEGNAPKLEKYVVNGNYEDNNFGSFDLTDTLVYSTANAASWSGSANFDPLYNTYCGYKTEVQGVCNHSGSKYVYDQNGHALVCDVCGRGFAMSEHSYGPDNKCICGYTYHEHSWEWQADEYSHYKVCTLCGQTIESGIHKFEKYGSCYCLICEQTAHLLSRHDYDENNHYDICWRCTAHYNVEPHTFEDNRYYYSYNSNGHSRQCDNCYYRSDVIEPHECASGELQHDSYSHFNVCDICGAEYNKESHHHEKADYSDFAFSNIIGLPEDKGLAILKERFGEECLSKNSQQGYDRSTIYDLKIPIYGKCTVCNSDYEYQSEYSVSSYNATIAVTDGIIRYVVSYLLDSERCPRFAAALPIEFKYGDIKKYAAAGTATFNGVTYDVKTRETDSSLIVDGGKRYYFDFYSDNYYVSYYVSNYTYIYDSAAMSGKYELMEIDDNQSVEGLGIYAFKKYTPGDVNNDGKVTLDDAILTLKKTMNVDIGSATFIAEAAELTGDNRLSLDDAIGVLKLAMKVQ